MLKNLETRIALDLHTDLQNVNTYYKQGNPILVEELINAAEIKLSMIQVELDDLRKELDLKQSKVIVGSLA